ncbi:MAG: imidazole glycerol phosphate synthase subunit HisH [Clostridia bacterium]|nr:imidazole glycerol phosphate synthase subunit HisH [Clostridia bacterium]
MVAVVNYGVGNLFSLCSSLKFIGQEAVVTSDPEKIKAADKIILPGVGAFGDAVEKLKAGGLFSLIRQQAQSGKDIMGICLGMQMLFEKSYEFGEHEGLGLLKGEIVPMKGAIDEKYKIPHIGWNALKIKKDSRLFKYIKDGDCVYFVHSFYADNCDESLIAAAEYGREITAAVEKDNVFGCQFHPEKSGEVGLSILRAFCEKE